MAVNENIYGSSSEWVITYYQQNGLTNKNKKAWFGGSTAQTQLRAGVAAGKLSYSEPIDKTLAYCGFGTESALNHRAYIGRDPENTSYLKIYEYQDSEISNWIFFEKTGEYGNTNNVNVAGYIRVDDLGRTAWNNNINDEYNYCNFLEPYTFINPHNMVLLISVVVGTSLDNQQNIELNQYINNRANYPYLYGAYVNLYFGTYPERSMLADKSQPTGWKPTTCQCLDNYVCLDKDIDLPMYGLSCGASAILIGSPSRQRTLYNDNDILNIFYIPENGKEHIKLQRIDNSLSYAYIEYYDGLIEDILKTAACFGLYFTTKESVAIGGTLTDADMYIGLLDENGIGHGEYLRGAQTANAPQAAASFTDMHSIGYDPMSGDHTRYTNDTQFYGTWSSSAFTKMYVLTASEVASLANELYTAVSQAPQGEEIERYNQSVFLTQNPIDCIISLKKFPMELPFSASVPMKLGSYTCITTGAPLLYSTGIYSFMFSRNNNNGLKDWFGESFLDFEQYTKAELTVPFCGTVEIPCCYLYEYDAIEVKLVVDFITGACTAYILSRGITIDSVSGSCSVSLPVNGIQSANLDSQIYSAASARNKSALTSGLGLIGGLAAIGVGIATGGIGAAVLGGIAAITSGANLVVQDKKIEYELQHMQLPLKQISAASGAISQSYDMRCKLRITRPKLDPDFDPEVYADTVGFACLIQGEVKDFTGLTVGDIDLDGVAAPEPVKKMLQSLFAEGVYL